VPISICRTCAVEQPDTDLPASTCAICSDERQYVRPTGQQWTTLEELAAEGHTGTITEVEPGLHGITIEPTVGIGQAHWLSKRRRATCYGIRPDTSTRTWLQR
jgi:hypothetical protein